MGPDPLFYLLRHVVLSQSKQCCKKKSAVTSSNVAHQYISFHHGSHFTLYAISSFFTNIFGGLLEYFWRSPHWTEWTTSFSWAIKMFVGTLFVDNKRSPKGSKRRVNYYLLPQLRSHTHTYLSALLALARALRRGLVSLQLLPVYMLRYTTNGKSLRPLPSLPSLLSFPYDIEGFEKGVPVWNSWPDPIRAVAQALILLNLYVACKVLVSD